MSSYTSPIAATGSAGQGTATPAASSAWAWTYWVSLAVVGLSLYMVEHNTYFASASFLEKGDGNGVLEAVSGSSSARQLSIVALGALGAVLLVIPARVPVIPNKGMLFLILIFCSLVLLSAMWAEESTLSFKRAIQPVLLMVAALGVVKHLQPGQLCEFTALFTGAMLLIGIGAVLSQGSFWQGEAYRFGGTLHPNAQAVNCAALCLASLTLFSERNKMGQLRWGWFVVFVVGLLFLLLTRSRTTTAAFAVGLLAFAFVGASTARKCVIAAIPVVFASLCALLLVLPDSGGDGMLLGAVRMGRSNEDTASLTGRLPIWQTVLSDIGSRPLLGYGYGSFWTPQRVYEYSFIRHWEFNHAHSAYFESLLNIGFVGLAIGLFVTLATIWVATRRFTRSRDIGYRFIAAMMCLALFQGAVDSNFVMIGFAPLLIMMCISIVALHSQVAHETKPLAIERPPLAAAFRTALNY